MDVANHGSRLRMNSRAPVLSVAKQCPACVLKSLLGQTRDPATLLVSRDYLEAIGGFNPAFQSLFELDLAVRLSYPIAHFPNALVRRSPNRYQAAGAPSRVPPDGEPFPRGRERNGAIDSLQTLAYIVSGLGNETAPFMPVIQRQLGDMVRKSDLVIGNLPDTANGFNPCI